MSQENPRSFDDYDDEDLDIRKPDASRPRRLWLGLVAAIVGVLAIATGAVILVVISANSDATAAKLVGAWSGQFKFGGQAIDAIYVFDRNGEFRQETLNEFGQVVDVSLGRWRVSFGKVRIQWDHGSYEVAEVRWTNDQTMDWHITDHVEPIQIGTVTTMRRQPLVPQRRR
jgi:hypothetical protein